MKAEKEIKSLLRNWVYKNPHLCKVKLVDKKHHLFNAVKYSARLWEVGADTVFCAEAMFIRMSGTLTSGIHLFNAFYDDNIRLDIEEYNFNPQANWSSMKTKDWVSVGKVYLTDLLEEVLAVRKVSKASRKDFNENPDYRVKIEPIGSEIISSFAPTGNYIYNSFTVETALKLLGHLSGDNGIVEVSYVLLNGYHLLKLSTPDADVVIAPIGNKGKR